MTQTLRDQGSARAVVVVVVVLAAILGGVFLLRSGDPDEVEVTLEEASLTGVIEAPDFLEKPVREKPDSRPETKDSNQGELMRYVDGLGNVRYRQRDPVKGITGDGKEFQATITLTPGPTLSKSRTGMMKDLRRKGAPLNPAKVRLKNDGTIGVERTGGRANRGKGGSGSGSGSNSAGSEPDLGNLPPVEGGSGG